MYKINLNAKKYGVGVLLFFFMFSAFVFGLGIFVAIKDKDHQWSEKILTLIPFLLFTLYALYEVLKDLKKIKVIKHLYIQGTLFKNVKYVSNKKGKVRNNEEKTYMYKPIVDLLLPNGKQIKITGDYNYNIIRPDESGEIDLLIDLNDTNKYYMDFNIEKK